MLLEPSCLCAKFHVCNTGEVISKTNTSNNEKNRTYVHLLKIPLPMYCADLSTINPDANSENETIEWLSLEPPGLEKTHSGHLSPNASYSLSRFSLGPVWGHDACQPVHTFMQREYRHACQHTMRRVCSPYLPFCARCAGATAAGDRR